MRVPRIDFAARPTTSWWVLYGAFLVAVVAAGAVKHHQFTTRASQLSAELNTIAGQLAAFQAPKTATKKELVELKVAVALALDLNKVLSGVERMQEEGTQLTSISFNGENGTLLADYAIDSVPRASSVTAALNSGYENSAWVFEGLSEASKHGGTLPYRGTWRAKYDKL